MAYIQDMMGNPQYGYEDEETRRRRLEQEAQAAGQPLNEYLARNESGSNPNIGYHFPPDQTGQRRSSAFGKYGITTAAYKDIQAADPYFQNKPIESLNVQDQDRAQTTYNSVLARQLQAYGVQPKPGDLAAADFLGARGYSDYLKTGRISPQAAAANGGEQRVKQIVEQRRQFNPAPASGAAVEQGQGAPVSPDQFAQQERQRQQAAQQTNQYSLAAGQPQTMGFQAQPTAIPVPTPAPEQTYSSQFIDRQGDLQYLAQIRNDANTPSWRKQAAGEQMYSLIRQEDELKRAEQRLQDIGMRMSAGDARANMELGKEITKTDGNWLRYILFKAMGPAFAREADSEASKLNLGNTWTQETITMSDGTERIVEVERRVDGSIRGARDLNGQAISNEDLGMGMAGSLPKGVHVNSVKTLVNPETGERIQEQTLSNAKVRYLINGRRYTGDTSKFEDFSQFQKDQDNKINAANAYLNKNYPAGATNEQRLTAYRMAGVHPREIESLMGPQKRMEGAAPTQQAPAPTQQAPAPTRTTQQAPTPSASGTVQPTTVMGPGPRPVEPQLTQRVGESTADFEQRKSTAKQQFQAQLEVWQKKQDRVEKKAEDLPKLEANAEDTINTIKDLLSHPGFEVSVGASIQPGFQFIPGTDKADWYSKFKQLQGQQFLQAYDRLRGGGHISEVEGQTAKAAMAALQNPNISEQEFRRNAEIYVETIKRGVNRARAEVGKEPLYRDVSERASPSRKLSAQDQQALDWANANSKDPRAAEIKKRLGM